MHSLLAVPTCLRRWPFFAPEATHTLLPLNIHHDISPADTNNNKPRIDSASTSTTCSRLIRATSHPGLALTPSKLSDGVIFADSQQLYHGSLRETDHRDPFTTYLLGLVIILIVVTSASISQTPVYWPPALHSTVAIVRTAAQLIMGKLMHLVALAMPAASGVIQRQTQPNPSLAVPAAVPSDASPNIDLSFPGFAFELASVVEYAQGMFVYPLEPS